MVAQEGEQFKAPSGHIKGSFKGAFIECLSPTAFNNYGDCSRD